MDYRRQDLLNRLEATANATPLVREDFSPLCFQIMYGLPLELQFRTAIHLCERYLPIYETKIPGSTWCRQLLGDLNAWFQAEGEATPDGPDEMDSADTIYHARFAELLCAYRYRDDPACLAAGVCSTIHGVVHARAQNVFLADDAVAARLEKEEDAWRSTWGDIDEEHRPPEPESFRELWKLEHNPGNNVAFLAVYRREWLYVVERLRTEAIWKYPEPDNLNAMMRALERWKTYWCYSMAPEDTALPQNDIDRSLTTSTFGKPP